MLIWNHDKQTVTPQALESTKTPYEMAPIPDEANRGWKLILDGQVLEPKQFALINERFGSEILYGRRQEGYDGAVIRERGGSVTLPWTMTESGQVLVGLVDEYRPTTGDASTLNVPRGMANLGETREQTAIRELGEETGYFVTDESVSTSGLRMKKAVEGVNANSTYFDTSRPENDGVAFYSLEVSTSHLILKHDDEGTVYYAFPDREKETAEDAATEKIFGSKFVPLETAMSSKDMFTGYAVGQLLVELLNGGHYIVPQNQQSHPPLIEKQSV